MSEMGRTPSPDDGACCNCGITDDVTFGPDPYAEEINGDSTPVWLCPSCYAEFALDI